MHLVEVEPVGAEPPQAVLDRPEIQRRELPPVRVVADSRRGTWWRGRRRPGGPERLADDLLGLAAGVDVGGVDDVDAASSARWMIRMPSSWSGLARAPKIIAPRVSGLTLTPVRAEGAESRSSHGRPSGGAVGVRCVAAHGPFEPEVVAQRAAGVLVRKSPRLRRIGTRPRRTPRGRREHVGITLKPSAAPFANHS